MNDPILWWTALGSIAGIGAFIITVRQALKTSKKKLRLKVFYNYTKRYGIQKTYIDLTVVNIGNKDVIVKNWGIVFRRKKIGQIMPDINDPFIKGIQKELPCLLRPEESLDLFISLNTFIETLQKCIDNGNLSAKKKVQFYVEDSTDKIYRIRSLYTAEKYISDNIKH